MIQKIIRSAALIAVAIVVVLPLLMTLGSSLMSSSELLEHIQPVLSGGTGRAEMPLVPAIPTLRQYIKLLMDTPRFLTMFWNSMRLVLPIVAGQAVIGTLAAWAFAHFKFPGREPLFMFYISLMMMPFQVTLVPSYLMLDRMMLLDTVWAVIIPGVFGTFSVFLLRQFFKAVPDALVEAAQIDGASEMRIFLTIALPIGAPGIASLCILSFLDNWNLIEQPMTFLRNQDLWPLSLYLTKIGETDVDVAMGASIITLMPALLLFFYGESYLVRGIQMTGIKE